MNKSIRGMHLLFRERMKLKTNNFFITILNDYSSTKSSCDNILTFIINVFK